MNMTVKDVARFLNVSDRTVYRWIQQDSIPAYRIHDQYRFNRTELLEWATAKKIGVSPELFRDTSHSDESLPVFIEALKQGGVHYRIEGRTIKQVFTSILSLLRLPDTTDRDKLLQILLSREALASTGVGDGIAIPHVRDPIVLDIPHSIIAVCFLEHPLEFGALDGKPVRCLCMLICPSIHAHLHLLSQLSFALRDTVFKQALLEQASRETIMKAAVRVQTALTTPLPISKPDREA